MAAASAQMAASVGGFTFANAFTSSWGFTSTKLLVEGIRGFSFSSFFSIVGSFPAFSRGLLPTPNLSFLILSRPISVRAWIKSANEALLVRRCASSPRASSKRSAKFCGAKKLFLHSIDW